MYFLPVRRGRNTLVKQIDYSAMTDLVEHFDPTTEPQKAAARRIVCGFAQGDSLDEQVADARDLMLALGIHPSQTGEDEEPRRPQQWW